MRTLRIFLLPAILLGASLLAAEQQFHPPETQDGRDFTPRAVKWVESQALQLPGKEELDTILLWGKGSTSARRK